MKLSTPYRSGARLAVAVFLACAWAGCLVKHDTPSESDTTTNWLHACQRDTDCRGESSCLSGTCSLACSPQAAAPCAALAAGAACVGEDVAQAYCDLPCDHDAGCRDLGADYACSAGWCRPRGEVKVADQPAPEELDASASLPPKAVDAGSAVSALSSPLSLDAAGSTDATTCPDLRDAGAPTWQPSAWEPYVSDAGREEQFRIVRDTFVGRWHGLATASWTAPYLVDLEFRADGHYSGRCSEIMEPCCLVFNTGTDRDSDLKQYHLLDAQTSGYLIGDIDLVAWYGGAFHALDIAGKLTYVERDRSGNGLRLHYAFGDSGPPIKFDLRRVEAQ